MKVLLSLLMAAPAAFAVVPKPLFRAAPRLNTKLAMASSIERSKYCIPLENIRLDDLPKVGGKTASLGEMIQELKPLGVDVPGGFGVSSTAYDAVLDRYELRERLELLLHDVDVTNLDDLADRGRQARQMIVQAGLPPDVRKAVESAYDAMCNGENVCSVAVRSSATAEDLPTASFAGQQASFLNVIGKTAVADAVLDCLASVFTDRAITYRVHNNFNHMSVKGAVVVQLMVRSDLASSGVAFTLDPDTGFRDVVVITGSYGLGESVVGGKVDPDEIQVFKPAIGKAKDPIIRRRIGRKQTSIVYTHGVSHERTKTIITKEADQSKPSFTDTDAMKLAKWCVDIEKHYSKIHGHDTPMDIEWAKDGKTGKLYIVQARPETVRSRQNQNALTQTIVTKHGNSVIGGTAIGSDAASGKVRVIDRLEDIASMQPGDILVADMTDPDWVPAIRMASAVVTNRGGRTCHAAIVSRELGVPCIVGTRDATDKLKTGRKYTVDCSDGNSGHVWEGTAEIERTKINIDDLPQTKTKVKLILADPDAALAHSHLPVAGVGLVRQEFVVANHIGIHPNAVLFPDRVSDEAKEIINERAKNDRSPQDFFIRKLSEGVGSIAAAFYPRPVIVRLGDFKSNEYCRLIGGENFEPDEENPMIGLRGASRYLHPDFKDAFELECRALHHVREDMGLDNVELMVPFCRTTDEAKGVLKVLEKNGLKQGEKGLKIHAMCEIPSNVLAIDDFSKYFDGFSIGSNDLTQLVLGVDRDSGDLAEVFDEDNPAVKTAISLAISGAARNGKPAGLCGQAPSDKPEFAAFLVEQGIDSISLTPDSVIGAIRIVADAEKKLMLEDEIMDSVGDKDGATVVAVPNAANFTKVAA
jgi:pyruvate,water dikinase